MISLNSFHHIVCAVDTSNPSLRMVQLAMELATRYTAELTLLTVVRLSDVAQPELAEYLQHEHNRDPPRLAIEEAARINQCLLKDGIGAQGECAATCDVRAGDPATEIVAWAREHAADLIVVGHRGRNPLAKILLGSVARSVIESAPCPVLVVPSVNRIG